jgi:acetyltransferase
VVRDENKDHLSRYESRVTLKNGREVFLRPVLPTDRDRIVDLFNRISPQYVYLRFLGHLQALPEEMLHRFTHIDYDSEFALAAVIEEEGEEAVIGVGRYAHDPHDNLTDLAVTVRDDWQHLGLGKSLLKKTIDVGKEHGIYRFDSMMDPRNIFIVQTLRDLGYEVKYFMRNGFYQVEILV